MIKQKKLGFLFGDVKKAISKNFELNVEQEQKRLENILKLNPKNVTRKEEFVKPWYLAGEKARKTKLGSLYHCQLKDKADFVCRVINCKRISEYQIDAYFTQLAKY